MNHTLVFILAFSIIIPAIIAVVRFKKIQYGYLPFIFCIWTGLLNECISYGLIKYLHKGNCISTNIYCIAEALLYTWLFKNFNFFLSRKFYIFLICFLCAVWLTDNVIISTITRFDSYFTIIYSMIIVVMSITVANRMIVNQVNLLVNPFFLICSGCILYFSLLALTEVFWLYGLNLSKSFRLNIYRMMAYINLIVNLIFALAILWMHRKQEFTPQQ